MDLQSLEKKIIYLKGIQNGIVQGTNPNVSKYKLQIDYEVNILEKQFQQLQSKTNHMIQKEVTLPISHVSHVKEDKETTPQLKKTKIHEVEVKEEEVEENGPTEEDHLKFIEVSKKINMLKDSIHQNNNFIKLLGRNKTYQNSLKIQNILKQNHALHIQIQQNQFLYDLYHLKINHYTLYKNKFYQNQNQNQKQNDNNLKQTSNIMKSENIKPKSILKKSNLNNMFKLSSQDQKEKHIQINIQKNEIKEIPSIQTKKTQILIKKNNHTQNQNHPIIQNHNQKEEKSQIVIDQNDSELMKEFQSTLGDLQKLLM